MAIFLRGFALGTLTAFTSMIGYNYIHDKKSSHQGNQIADEFGKYKGTRRCIYQGTGTVVTALPDLRQ